MHEGKPVLIIQIGGNGASTARLYIYLLNVPSFSSRYFNKIKRTSRLGGLLALSLEILIVHFETTYYFYQKCVSIFSFNFHNIQQ